MESLTIVTWLWGTKYSRDYVNKLERSLARNLKQPYLFMLVEPPQDEPLIRIDGCFVRLRMFNPNWQFSFGLTGRIVCIDLDVVITGPLDALFDRPEPFVILQGANSINPCPYNGSLWMLRAGAHPEVWRDFSVAEASKLKFFKFPDDQNWMAHKLPNAAGWQVGQSSGVWSFRKRGWPAGDRLPGGARLVCFPGAADPAQVEWLPWVKEHWRL